ncbi:hypothetical protein TNCV_4306181 [Trichonephila clavipes]|nr:hypothetical protein TNCV_4306181 [Trichonephila clavipes]
MFDCRINYEYLQWYPSKNEFPVRVIAYQRSRSFTWESIEDRTLRRLCSEASQPLTFIYPADREVTGAVSTSIFGFEVHHLRGELGPIAE